MDPNICLVLLGVLAFTNGKPAKDESSFVITNEHDLQDLLKVLYRDGKFDISFSHHEDGPDTHHVDTTRISRHDKNSHARHSPSDEENYSHAHGNSRSHSHRHHDAEDHQSHTNIENLNLIYKNKAESRSNNKNFDYGLFPNRNAALSKNSNVNDIVDLLKNLDNNVERGNNNREDNNNRGQNYNNRDAKVENDRASDRDDDRNDYNNARSNNYNDYREERYDDVNGDRLNRDEINNYREDRDRNDSDDTRVKEDNVEDVGKDRDNDDDRGRFDRANRRERRLPNEEEYSQGQSQSRAKKFKVSDELDAIVLDMSDLNKSFGKSLSRSRGSNQESQLKFFENVEFDNLLEAGKSDGVENLKSEAVFDLDSSPVEAIVVDLTDTQNELAREVKGLVKNLETSLKKRKPNKKWALNKAGLVEREDSKILSHNENNNNVYVPQWLLEDVASRTSLKGSRDENLKNLLPLTAKQKEKLLKALEKRQSRKTKRIFRRSVEDDIGVPFHLEIQGLGQVNP